MTEAIEPRYPDLLVETGWLADHLGDAALRLYDCTTYLRYAAPGAGIPYTVESGRRDYETAHISGSAFLDLQGELSRADSPYRFTMLPLDDLARVFGRKGIGDGLRVVLYSRGATQWATRIWWMLRAVGFDNAAILNGGWEKWEREGRAVETGSRDYPAARLTAVPRPGLFVGKDDVLAAIGDAGVCTLNALAADLHSGENPRYGRPGRIPGSVNVPALSLSDPEAKTLLPLARAKQAFEAAGVTPNRRIISYCGGGIAATLDAFLLHQLGYEDITVYDNSLSEWAKDESLPIETGR